MNKLDWLGLFRTVHQVGTSFVESTPEGIKTFKFEEVVMVRSGCSQEYKNVLAAFPLLTKVKESISNYDQAVDTSITFLRNGEEYRWVKTFDPNDYGISRISLTFQSWLAFELAARREGALSISYVSTEPHKFNPLISRETLIMHGRRMTSTTQMRLTQCEAREIMWQ